MKTTTKFLLTALLMLFSVGVKAQSGSTPIKGDVNEDGVVDVADINAIIEIMKNGEGTSGDTKYYWYAGIEKPTAENIRDIAIGSSNEIEHWEGKEFIITNTTSNATPAYVCTPVVYNVVWKDTNGFEINLVEVENSRFTYNDIEYKVQKRGRDLSSGASLTVRGYYQNKYYWYVGQTDPNTMTTISPIVNDNTSPGWRLIGETLPTYSASNKLFDGDNNTIVTGETLAKQYIILPNDTPACPRDGFGNDASTVDIYTKWNNTITLNGVAYKVYESIGKSRKLLLNIY